MCLLHLLFFCLLVESFISICSQSLFCRQGRVLCSVRGSNLSVAGDSGFVLSMLDIVCSTVSTVSVYCKHVYEQHLHLCANRKIAA